MPEARRSYSAEKVPLVETYIVLGGEQRAALLPQCAQLRLVACLHQLVSWPVGHFVT